MIDNAGHDTIQNLRERAWQCLQRSRDFVRGSIIQTGEQWGADKFLNGAVPPREKGLYGTACAVSALIYCGEDPHSDYVQNCLRLLASHRFRVGGGWATSTIKGRSKVAMVNATCYALNALLDAGQDPCSRPIEAGLGWLKRTLGQTVAWGHYPQDSLLRLTATCNALMTLARAAQLGGDVSPAGFSRPVNWLISTQDPESGGWSPEGRPEAGYTTMAVLALARASRAVDAIAKGASLLQAQVGGWETVREHFRVPTSDGGLHDEEYHIFTQAVALSALCAAYRQAYLEAIVQGADRLIAAQEASGVWQDRAGKVLCWEQMYACRALRDVVALADSRLLLGGDGQRLGEVMSALQEVRQSLQRLDERLTRLERQSDWRGRWRRLAERWQLSCSRLAGHLKAQGRRLAGHWSFALLTGAAGTALYAVVYIRWLAPAVNSEASPWLSFLARSGFFGVFFGLSGLVRGLQRR